MEVVELSRDEKGASSGRKKGISRGSVGGFSNAMTTYNLLN